LATRAKVAIWLCLAQPSAMLDGRMHARAGEVRRRVAAALAAVAIVSATREASAGPAEQLPTVEDPAHTPPPVVDEDMSSSERLERARSLYDRGRGKFETFDYIGAIELWTQAYSELPEEEEFASIRAKLMFNIAAARLSAFEIDDNIAHLRQAKRLMDLYVESIGDATDDEAADAREWQEKIAVRLADAEAARKKAQPPAAKPPAPAAKPPDAAALRRARALTISGAVTLSVGAALVGAMGGMLAWGARLESRGKGRADDPGTTADDLGSVVKRGKTANVLSIAMGAGGGALLGTGVGLLVAGLVATKKHGGRDRAVVPVVGPGVVGVSAAWRF
jgi:hypothetical protein